MYRIEVAPGEETVFRTIEELAVGIRNGVVTPRSRIFHNASQKWLPIGLHPHYKKAMELPAASAAHPPAPTSGPAASRPKPRVESHATERHPEPRPVPPPAPASDRRATDEHPAVSRAPAPKIPAPVTSPVVAMQQEVLRDLPVVAIPEPFPWSAPKAPAPPPPGPSVHAPQPPAPSVHAPRPPMQQSVHAPRPPAPSVHAPRSAAEPIPTPITPPPPTAPIAQAVQAQPTATVTYAPLAFAERTAESADAERLDEFRGRPTARRSHRATGRPILLLGVAAATILLRAGSRPVAARLAG
jgi:hypothetical protein